MISRNPSRLLATARRCACSRCMKRAEQVAAQGSSRSTPSHTGPRPASRQRGLSLVELLIALAISAALLTATMVAIDASFKAYASATETASAQTATRMVVHRILTLLRTSYAVGPASVDDDASITYSANRYVPYTSDYIELIDSRGWLVRLEYRADDQELWATFTEPGQPAVTQPMLSGVSRCTFSLSRDRNPGSGVWEIIRGSLDLEVEPDQNNTLPIEATDRVPIRAIASTMPRKLE